jgi:hypothetical protein
MKSNCMIDFTHGMSLHDHAKKNQYFIKNTSTQVVLDKHAGALPAEIRRGEIRNFCSIIMMVICRCSCRFCNVLLFLPA